MSVVTYSDRGLKPVTKNVLGNSQLTESKNFSLRSYASQYQDTPVSRKPGEKKGYGMSLIRTNTFPTKIK